MDLSTEMASVALLHSSCSGDGSVDRDGVSGTVAVELTSLATAAAVDLSTETVAMAPLQSTFGSGGSVDRERCQWKWCSRGDESGDGGASGSIDRDGGSRLVAVERWRQCYHCSRAGASGDGGGGGYDSGGVGYVDRDSVGSLVAVKPASSATAAAVDLSTEMASVALLQSG